MLLKLGVILPHVKVFGGVKRFFEIGNLLVASGHSFTVFTPEGLPPDWFEFRGNVGVLEKAVTAGCDVLFITEPDFLPLLRKSNARLKVFYAVLQRSSIRRVAREKDIIMLANSGRLYDYLGGKSRTNVFKAMGGIDIRKFAFHEKETKPDEPFTVMVYGRFYRKKKGTLLVVKACERLYKAGYNIKLLLFDAPVDDASRTKVQQFTTIVPFEFFVDYPVKDIASLYYKADVFVSAERNAGWANTAAEAMACGVPVIATSSGTEDFVIHEQTGLVVWRHSWFIGRAIKKLYADPALRKRFSINGRTKIEEFTWERLARTIEEFATEKLASKSE
jgi:glycosyltransferase involved in cell wall biosynthesis